MLVTGYALPKLDLGQDQFQDYRAPKLGTPEETEMVLVPAKPVTIAPQGDVVQRFTRGTEYLAHYLNVPLFDEYVWKGLAKKLLNTVREYNRQHVSSYFQDHSDVLDIIPSGISLIDDEALVNALITWYRDYFQAMTRLTACQLQESLFGSIQNTPFAGKWSYKFKFSNQKPKYMGLNGMPFSSSVTSYLAEHTRLLSTKGYGDAPVFSFPMWDTDLRGSRGMCFLSQEAKDNGLAGPLPLNTQYNPLTGIADFWKVSNAFSQEGNPTAPANTGYIATAMARTSQYWVNYLSEGTLMNYSVLKDPLHTLVIIGQQLGLFTESMDWSDLFNKGKSNSIGDLRAFAAENMVLGSKIMATVGQRDRDNRLTYTGMNVVDYAERLSTFKWTINDSAFADQFVETPATGAIGALTLNHASMYWIDHMSRGVQDGGSGPFEYTRSIALDTQDVFAALPGQNESVLGCEYVDKLFTDGMDGNPVVVYGSSMQEVADYLAADGENKPFMVEAEVENGIRVIHQPYTPLINTEDVFQCGFYKIVDYTTRDTTPWDKFLANADVSTWRDATVAAALSDGLVFIGDAIGLPPLYHFSRSHLSRMPYTEVAGATMESSWFGDIIDSIWELVTGTDKAEFFRLGVGFPVKPITREIPNNMSVLPTADVYVSESPFLADMEIYGYDATMTAWEDYWNYSYDGTDIGAQKAYDLVPADVLAKYAWLWFRTGPVEYITGDADLPFVKLLPWLSVYPYGQILNIMSEYESRFNDQKIANENGINVPSLIMKPFQSGEVSMNNSGQPILDIRQNKVYPNKSRQTNRSKSFKKSSRKNDKFVPRKADDVKPFSEFTEKDLDKSVDSVKDGPDQVEVNTDRI